MKMNKTIRMVGDLHLKGKDTLLDSFLIRKRVLRQHHEDLQSSTSPPRLGLFICIYLTLSSPLPSLSPPIFPVAIVALELKQKLREMLMLSLEGRFA